MKKIPREQWMHIFADPTSRGKAVCKCKKLAYQRAVENAFSKVILVVLSNGKVAVEVDTTQPELLLTEKVLDDENVLKVLAVHLCVFGTCTLFIRQYIRAA